jgi:putative ABC transport system permease protein
MKATFRAERRTPALFGVTPHDGGTLAAVAGLVAAATLTACLVPARRAAAVDPAVALRAE